MSAPEPKKPPIPGMPTQRAEAEAMKRKDSPETAWEIYNKRAAIVDKEMVKDWNDSLIMLLVFAALFSAVLTAFIIESKKMLEEDPVETSREILLTISRQLANASIPAYEPPPIFVAPAYAIRVNAYLFISLLSSLIAALGAVLALQWIGSYDLGLSQSSPKDRAIQRHFRNMGLETWRMADIIAFLPILIFLSLFLSLIGLADWLFHIHKGISAIVIAALAIAALFYIVTTVIGVIYVNAPFKTAHSKSLGMSFQSLLLFKDNFFSPFEPAESENMTHKEQYSFSKREMTAANHAPMIELKALLWAVNSIELLPHQRDTFKILMKKLMELPVEHLLHPIIDDAPWQSIFTIVFRPHFGKPIQEYQEVELTELLFLNQALLMIGRRPFDQQSEIHRFLWNSFVTFPNDEGLSDIASYMQIACIKRSDHSCTGWVRLSLLGPILRTSTQTLAGISRMALHVMKEKSIATPETYFEAPPLYECIAESLKIDLQTATTCTPIPTEILNDVLELATIDLGGQVPPKEDPLKTFLLTLKNVKKINQLTHIQSICSIQTQYLARLARMPSLLNGGSYEMRQRVFQPLEAIISAAPETEPSTKIQLLQLLVRSPVSGKFWEDHWSVAQDFMNIVSGLREEPDYSDDNRYDTKEWLIRTSIACSKQLRARHYSTEFKILLMRFLCETMYKYKFTGLRLKDIGDLHCRPVTLAIAALDRFSDLPPGKDPFPPGLFLNPMSNEVAEWYFNELDGLEGYYGSYSSGCIQFIHRTLRYGSQSLREKCVTKLGEHYARNLTYAAPVEHFPHTVLRDLLEIPGGLIKSDRNKLLNTFATQPWFCDEFSKAGGHAWLERAVANVNSTEDYYSHLAMIGSAVNSRGSFTNLRDWAIAARDILTRLPKKPATDRAQLTAHHLRTIMQGQIDCKIRPADFPDIMKANVFRIFDEEKFWEDGLEEDIDAISRYNYVKSWHLQDWEDWCRYMKGIVDGLERGYINEFLPRYPIDPDGLCCKFLSD